MFYNTLFKPLQKSKTPINEYTGYETYPSSSEAPILEFWGMGNKYHFIAINSIAINSIPLWPRLIVPNRVSSKGKTEISNHFLYLKPFNCVQTND